MSLYGNDRRVTRIGDREYEIHSASGRWMVEFDADAWQSYDPLGRWSETASQMATADGAIFAIIGDPR